MINESSSSEQNEATVPEKDASRTLNVAVENKTEGEKIQDMLNKPYKWGFTTDI